MEIHLLGVGQWCSCEAQHVCKSCQGNDDRLRATNAKLLSALEAAVEHADRWHGEGQAGEGRRCTDCIEFQAQARAVIEEARK